MEMEAPAPLPKKRKSGIAGSSESEEISSREPPPAAAMDAPDSHIQQPPPGAEGAEKGLDRISGLPDAVLPDAILGDIVSLLRTREGARTQTLASRWRHLWRSAPLNLDYEDLPAEGDVLIGLISQILSSHAGPGRRLRISAHLCHEPATVDSWRRSAALSNLQELELFRFKVQLGCSNDFIASQRKLLQLEKRASRGARFEFTNHTHRRKLEDIKHVQDLSVADPFEW